MSRYDPYPDASLYCSTRKQLRVEVDCTPEAVEQFKATLRRKQAEIPAGQLDWLLPSCYERLTPTTLRHRKETEMPSDHFSRYFDRKPKPVRKEREMTDWTSWCETHQHRMAQIGETVKTLERSLAAPIGLMTPEQVKARLQAGEDPLLLSIEHWVQNAAYIKEHGSLPRQSYRDKTCALCVTHADDRGESQCTKKCPLGISQGTTCGGFSLTAVGPWAQFNLDPSYANAMNMVATLASLKPPEPKVPQFYIDGEGEGKVALRLVEDRGMIALQAIADDREWYLLDIRQDGSVFLPRTIGENTGLDLDDAGRLRFEV